MGVEPIALPPGWQRAALEDLAETFSGGTPKRSVAAYYGGHIPWVKSGEVAQGNVSITEEAITDRGLSESSARWVPAGAVLVAMYGATAGKVGRLEIDATTNQAVLAVLADSTKAENSFLRYALDNLGPVLLRRVQGSGQPNLSGKILRRSQLMVPPLAEQRKIAAILGAVDEAIEATQAVIDQVQEVKKGLMQELLTRGLPGRHTRFKHTEIGEIPDSWAVHPLAELADVQRGKFSHRPRNDPRYYGGPYPFVQTGDVAACDGYIMKFSQTLNDRGLSVSRIFPAGTILITIAANIGETGIASFDLSFPDSLVGIIANDRMDRRFLRWVLASRKSALEQFSTESAQKNINLQTLRPLLVQVPSLKEQQYIGDQFDTLVFRTRREIAYLDQLQTLKKSLMSVLLTGERRVPTEPTP